MTNTMVVDKTGLVGEYDFELRWSVGVRTVPIPNEPPPLDVALAEQLGLRLEETMGPAQVLVIDRISQPSPD
jgi:uncharacterized protein (TIGR03435 family)